MINNLLASKRIEYIDVFRAFGIILMVMGHIGFGLKFDHFIHAFHMPMFFFVSGYFFKHGIIEEMSFKGFVKKKCKALLIPYIIFGIAHYLFYLILRPFDTKPLQHLLFINTEGLPICGALWFLTALFFADIIFSLIDWLVVDKRYKVVLIAVIALFGNISSILHITLPWALNASFVGIGLYYIGYFIHDIENRKAVNKIMNLGLGLNSLLALLVVYGIFLNGYINMREGIYAIIPLFWLNAIGAIIVGMNYSKLIYSWIKGTLVCKWLIGIGQNSIVFVCLNQVVILVIRKLFDYVVVPLFISKICILIISLGVLYIISEILANTRLRVFIGRF